MPSFRAKVLDALDIHKKTIKLQVNERFPKTYSTVANATIDPAMYGEPAVLEGVYSETGYKPDGTGVVCNGPVDYAISHCVKQTTIGPSFTAASIVNGVQETNTAQLQKLDVLGFVVGDRPGLSHPSGRTVDTTNDPPTGASGLQNEPGYPTIYMNSYPDTLQKSGELKNYNYNFDDPANTYAIDVNKYSGFHYLNGLYDPKCKELQHMRKSAMPVDDLDTVTVSNGAAEHSHKDWPDNVNDQVHLMNEFPYSDSLYYHQMRLQMLITGITIPGSSEKASNHRGVVRMLILRPRMPSVKTRWTGDTNQPVINMGFPPHWDTDLFYSGKKTLAGRMDNKILRNTANAARSNVTNNNNDTQTIRAEDYSHMSPTFGFENRKTVDPNIELDPTSIHYSHSKPEKGVPHDLTAFDLFSAPINRNAYSVIADKTFTLDTRHHGVASTRMENIVIPFNKKVKFGGRKPHVSFNGQDNCPLDDATFDEPLNLPSRPIILMLSLDQKISCQVTGYTAISEC